MESKRINAISKNGIEIEIEIKDSDFKGIVTLKCNHSKFGQIKTLARWGTLKGKYQGYIFNAVLEGNLTAVCVEFDQAINARVENIRDALKQETIKAEDGLSQWAIVIIGHNWIDAVMTQVIKLGTRKDSQGNEYKMFRYAHHCDIFDLESIRYTEKFQEIIQGIESRQEIPFVFDGNLASMIYVLTDKEKELIDKLLGQ